MKEIEWGYLPVREFKVGELGVEEIGVWATCR